ncbi:MAG: Ig-like domain-containing protein, partial [Mobilitalea sp.]
KSVAIVDATGTVTAMKNGTAVITATVDGVLQTCEIVVNKPDITLSSTEITLKSGTTTTLTAKVSSSNAPIWSTSNNNILSIDSKGVITAKQKGRAYVYAAEDGTKVRCTVYVTD